MKERLGWLVGISVAVLYMAGIVFVEVKGAARQAIASEKYKRESLEYAKQGWVYVCGWNCRWERLPGFDAPGLVAPSAGGRGR